MKDDKKEELYQKFEASMKFWIDKKSIDQHSLDASFDFFYQHIEESWREGYAAATLKEIQLEELLKAMSKTAEQAVNDGEVHYCPECKKVQPIYLTYIDPDDTEEEPDLIVCLVCKEAIGFIQNL